MENAARSMENLIAQLEESEDLPMHELLSLDNSSEAFKVHSRWKQQRRLSYSNASSERSMSLRKSETIQNMTLEFEKTSRRELKGIMMT